MRTPRFNTSSIELYLDRHPEKFPRPRHPGLAPTTLQLGLLHRIYAAPNPVVWPGFTPTGPKPAYCRDLPYAPGLHCTWLRDLWNSGLIVHDAEQPDVIVVATRGLPLLNDRHLAHERRRWAAISVLSAALVRKQKAYAAMPAAQRARLKPPPRQMTTGMIQTVQIALGRGGERLGATA